METFERSTYVAAPLERVWDFHSTVEGLEALTPGWMGLRVEAVRGPDGSPDPDVLETGAEIALSTSVAGVGPQQRWTSRIAARDWTHGAAYFRDEMLAGPFPEWEHTHLFYRDGDGTLLRDIVRYELPGGSVGRTLSPLAIVGLEPLFRYRHRRTRELLE
ncbi:MAG: SRPBCC family protein [Salinirussus sp.]